MKQEESEALLLALALLYRRFLFIERRKQFHERALHVEDKEASFLIELILCGSFDEEMLEAVFLLPEHLIAEVKEEFLN